jgi:aspartyl-tRNA(Asn)/glutamyl-tRNA(Gln) amidotransferase subunit A
MDAKDRIRQVKEKDEKINSFIALDTEGVARKGVAAKGMLCDLFIGVKSNLNVEGLVTSAGSKTLENYISPYDATAVGKIKAEGGTILGMLNMDEFACGSSGETSFFGPTDNPAAPGHIPGGSSSGSAAAVAAGFVDAALGTDTGGSIRNPASHCGVVGFKPTYGVVSRYGLIDLAMSLDQIGPLARDVATAALLLEAVAGHDGRDETSLSLEPNFYQFRECLSPKIKGMRLGYAKEFDALIQDKGIKTLIHQALDRLSSAGAEIVEVSLPNLEVALPTYYLNVYVEFFSATRKYDGRRFGHRIEDVCGEEVLRRILLGSYISQKEYSGKYYRRALMARSVIRKDLADALKDVDALVGPTVPKLPHKLGAKIEDPMVMYAYDVFTVPVNLAGLPAGTVPAGKTEGIPTGLQVIGKPLDDQKVLNIMAAFEERR